MTDFGRFGPEIDVSSDSVAGTALFPSIASLANGGFVVVWYVDLGDPLDNIGAIKGQVYDVDGHPVGQEFLVNTYTNGYQNHPTVTGLADGGFVVSWEGGFSTGPGLGAQRFDGSGNAIGSEFVVSPSFANRESTASLTTLADGSFVVTWTSRSEDPFHSNDAPEIRGQIYDTNGAALGSEFIVNSPSANNAFRGEEKVTALASGGFVVTWESKDSYGAATTIKSQIFDASGNKLGGEFPVSSASDANAGYDQFGPTVIGLANGNFAIVWSGFRDAALPGDPAPGIDLKMQMFDATGATIGGETVVNASVDGPQFQPAVTALHDGGFLVAWATFDPTKDGSEGAVLAQAFGANGDRVGPEFLVNVDGAGLQDMPTVATLANGDVVFGWTSFSTTGGIQAAIYSQTRANAPPTIVSDGGLLDALVVVNENTQLVTTVVATDPDGATLTYSIVGGQDAGLFSINSQTGALSFVTPPDFEHPDHGASAGSGNTYYVSVGVSDGAFTDLQNITIEVADVMEGVFVFGTSRNDVVDASHSVAGQSLPTGQEDVIYTYGGNDEVHALAGNDYIDGGTGNDRLFGDDGNDSIFGASGNDLVVGGLGRDQLSGGEGRDAFVFLSVNDSRSGNADTISDFSQAEHDRIDLSAIDANVTRPGNQDFKFIGTSAFSGVAGQLRYEISFDQYANFTTTISGDVDGDGVADFEIQLSQYVMLAAGDFML